MPKLIKIIFLIFIPITAIALFSLNNYKSSYSILDSREYEIGFYCDEDEGGTSTVQGGKNDNKKYWMKYTLGDKGYEYPYAVMVISKKDSLPIRISKLDTLNIKLSSKSSEYINISAYVYLKDHTVLDDNSTYLPLVLEIPTNDNLTNFSLGFNDFRIPRWWLLENNISEPKSVKFSLESIMYFTISSSLDKELGVEDYIEVEDMEIHKDIRLFLINILKLLFIYFSSLIFIYYSLGLLKKLKRNKVISYKSLDLKKESTKENKIIEYIGLNYSDPGLSLTKISDNVALPIKNISTYINRTFKLSFPEYLNLIRINEAKKILRNTDIKIVDIAISIGFNSAGHFNRVFKNHENCTPSSFRKENRSIITT